jgi:flagellar biosynthesis protein FlhB
MAEQKTEQPTHYRLQKARGDGRFPASRDFIVSVQLGIVLMAGWSIGGTIFGCVRNSMTQLLDRAFSSRELTVAEMPDLFRRGLLPSLEALLGGGAAIALIVVLVQMATTGFGLSTKQLMPDLQRLNPMSRLKQMPHQNFASMLKALALLPIIAFLLYEEINPHLNTISNLAVIGLGTGLSEAGQMMRNLLTRLVLILAVVGIVDFVRQRKRFIKDLRMTKQEVKDEAKDMDGNPQMKMRIRRLQRDIVRQKMMQAVPQATAVIVNPTHYAVALRYDMNAKAVPTVVAKGKNHLALQIRKKAAEHGVPITENKPLAQALYKAVGVDQEIPPHLYRAVAEVLAYIYRTMSGRP